MLWFIETTSVVVGGCRGLTLYLGKAILVLSAPRFVIPGIYPVPIYSICMLTLTPSPTGFLQLQILEYAAALLCLL